MSSAWIAAPSVAGGLAQALAEARRRLDAGIRGATVYLEPGPHRMEDIPADVRVIFGADATLLRNLGSRDLRGEILAPDRVLFPDALDGEIRFHASAGRVANARWWPTVDAMVAATDHSTAPRVFSFPGGAYSVTSVRIRAGSAWLGEMAEIVGSNGSAGTMITVEHGKPHSRPTVFRGLTFRREAPLHVQLPAAAELLGEVEKGPDLDTGPILGQALVATGAGPTTLRDCTFLDGRIGLDVLGNQADVQATGLRFMSCRSAVRAIGGAMNLQFSGADVSESDVAIDINDAPAGTPASVLLHDVQTDGELRMSLRTGTHAAVTRCRFSRLDLTSDSTTSTSLLDTELAGPRRSTVANPGELTINDCRFELTGRDSGLAIRWDPDAPRGDVLIRNCSWLTDEGPLGPGSVPQPTHVDLGRHATQLQDRGQPAALEVRGGGVGARVRVVGADIREGFAVGARVGGAAQVQLANLTIAATHGVAIRGGDSLDLLVTGLEFRGDGDELQLEGDLDRVRVTFDSHVLTAAQNRLRYRGRGRATFLGGGRQILADGPPTTADPGLPGDIWRLRQPVPGAPFEWIAATHPSPFTRWRPCQPLAPTLP